MPANVNAVGFCLLKEVGKLGCFILTLFMDVTTL